MATQQQLDEAIAARHALMTGKAVVSVGYGTRKVEYALAQLPALNAYIAQLQAELNPPQAAPVRNRITYFVPQG